MRLFRNKTTSISHAFKVIKRFMSESSYRDFVAKEPGVKPLLMTGVQPTGYLHIGNYLGAIKQTIELQNSGKFEKLILSVVDLHSISVPQDPLILKKNIFINACSLIACGLDHPNTVLFQQSAVPHHAELSWILGCLTTLNKLDHLPQWKEKNLGKDNVPLGLYSYPVLQAADILLYKGTHVPVGEDQLKHLELVRHLAKSFNRTFSPIFPLPKAVTGGNLRVKSLRDPAKKMSKSEKDKRGRIELIDSADEIREKLKKAVTDTSSGGMIGYDVHGRPGISNIIDIYASFAKSSPDRVYAECRHLNTVEFKERAAEVIIEALKPIRAKIVQLKSEPQHVLSLLEEGRLQATQMASQNMSQVKKLVGFAL